MAISVKYYQIHNEASITLTEYIIEKIIYENQVIINKIVDNLSYEKIFVLHLKKNVKQPTYSYERKVFQEIMNNPKILDNIQKNVHIRGVLKDMEIASTLDKSSIEFKYYYDKIINVGEFK
jgi:hypothetical protein